jgi:hypothetical protein
MGRFMDCLSVEYIGNHWPVLSGMEPQCSTPDRTGA